MVSFKVKLKIHTIKDIGLDLCFGIAEFIESIGSFVWYCSVLNGSNNSNKHIILNTNHRSESRWKITLSRENKAKNKPLSLFHIEHQAVAHAKRGDQLTVVLKSKVKSDIQAQAHRQTSQKFLWWLQLTDLLEHSREIVPFFLSSTLLPERENEIQKIGVENLRQY